MKKEEKPRLQRIAEEMRKEFKIQGTRYIARIWRRKRYCKKREDKRRNYAVSGGRGDSEYKTSSPVYALYQRV
jgi:hypothetical protein